MSREKLSKTGLLPCPFCGSIHLSGIAIPEMNEDASTEPEKVQAACFVQCDECYSNGPVRKTLKEARVSWQIRAEEV